MTASMTSSCRRPKQQRRFRSHHQGVVKDTAIPTDASGQTHTVVNEKETGSQSLHVDLVGGWWMNPISIPNLTSDWTQDGNGYSITIQEDGRAPIDFKLTSGSGRIPRSITRKPSTWCWKGCRKGQGIRRQWQGADPDLRRARWQGQSLYQVDVTSLGNLQIQPPPNSTADCT